MSTAEDTNRGESHIRDFIPFRFWDLFGVFPPQWLNNIFLFQNTYLFNGLGIGRVVKENTLAFFFLIIERAQYWKINVSGMSDI